jgi:TIGR03009 family protein
MRHSFLTVAGVLLLGGTVPAQQPPAQQPAAPALDPAHNRLDALLMQWEKEMAAVQTLYCNCTRTTVDKVFQVSEVFEGAAQYMKPNLAMLEMRKKDKPDAFEKYICTGTFLYQYAPKNKEIHVYELPPPKPGQVADDNILSFLFGMKAEEAKRRYDLQLVKEDQYYIYLKITPRLANDKQDFQEARLVLNQNSFLPRELWFVQPNGNEIKWDIPKIQNGVRLNRTDFTAPATPPGWTMVKVPRANDVPPRVVRPKQ